ncbi:MAG: cupin domain-containing protein, partial [Ignisphaera sp.]
MNRVKIVNVHEVPKQRVENGVNTWIKVLFSVDEMPTFSMRIFEMDEGGYIEAHSHPWEHEIL